MANVYDISIEQGSSFDINLVAKDSSKNPLNLSGYSSRGGIKYSYGSDEYLVEFTSTIDPSFTGGIINISLTSAQTSSLPVTKGVYDIEVYASNGYTFKVLKGYAEIAPEVTTY